MLQLKKNQRRLFGASSEKSAYDEQLNLFNEAEATVDEVKADEPEPELSEAVKPYIKKKRLLNKKESLPEGIPVETIEHTLPEEEQVCPECGEAMHPIGRETTREELVFIPASVKIRKHVCIAYGCRSCEKNGTSVPIIKAPRGPDYCAYRVIYGAIVCVIKISLIYCNLLNTSCKRSINKLSASRSL